MEKPFEEEEIKKAVFSLAADKAPGPDGFILAFFQHCWDNVKSNLKDLFREFHMNEEVSQGLNSTFITLIPKRVGANSLPLIIF